MWVAIRGDDIISVHATRDGAREAAEAFMRQLTLTSRPVRWEEDPSDGWLACYTTMDCYYYYVNGYEVQP